MSTAYVITWRYFDGSDCGAVSVHWTQHDAEQMLAILNMHASGKCFAIEAVPCAALP